MVVFIVGKMCICVKMSNVFFGFECRGFLF